MDRPEWMDETTDYEKDKAEIVKCLMILRENQAEIGKRYEEMQNTYTKMKNLLGELTRAVMLLQENEVRKLEGETASSVEKEGDRLEACYLRAADITAKIFKKMDEII